MNITIFNEGRDERRKPGVLTVYPDTIGGVLKDIVAEMEEAILLNVGSLYDEECGLTESILEKTDVLIYWSHGGNHEFPDRIAKRIQEQVICCNPTHPIAKGIEERFELSQEESYGEFMDIPKPDDVIFLGWFENGEVCRSGCTFTRGNGKIFFFQPGHETNPSFYHPQIRKIIQNACRWAKPSYKMPQVFGHHPL